MKKEHEWDKRRGPHVCRPLMASTVRQIHWILSGAMERAVRCRSRDPSSPRRSTRAASPGTERSRSPSQIPTRSMPSAAMKVLHRMS